VSYRRLAILLAVVCVSCQQPARQPAARKAPGGPQVQATVVTIRTATQPAGTLRVHSLVIAGDRVRSTGEQDLWRLFDTKANTVTYVDDAARTVRTEALGAIIERRRRSLSGELPSHYPRVLLTHTGEKRSLLNLNAEQNVIQSGEYRRELWFGQHPAIPAGLFAMMQASEPLTSPLAPMMRQADEALLAVKGYPLLERIEVPFEKQKLIVERSVTGIAKKNVPEALVTVPKDYLDLTPKPKPAGR
jgi:hypothetical protein